MRKVWVICSVLLVSWIVGTGSASASPAEELFRKGFVASMARDWDAAIESFGKAIELNPKYAEAYFQRAITFEMTNRPKEAIADYERAIKFKPDYYLAMEYLAKLYQHEGQYSKAVDVYTRALPFVQNPKWRSMVKWWISEAKKKTESASQQGERGGERGPKGSLF